MHSTLLLLMHIGRVGGGASESELQSSGTKVIYLRFLKKQLVGLVSMEAVKMERSVVGLLLCARFLRQQGATVDFSPMRRFFMALEEVGQKDANGDGNFTPKVCLVVRQGSQDSKGNIYYLRFQP